MFFAPWFCVSTRQCTRIVIGAFTTARVFLISWGSRGIFLHLVTATRFASQVVDDGINAIEYFAGAKWFV